MMKAPLALTTLLLLFSAYTGLSQTKDDYCGKEYKLNAEPKSYSKAKPLADDHGFEKDSVQITFNLDSASDDRAYVYVINTREFDVIFRYARMYVEMPPIVQEALDTNGNWVQIEYITKNEPCFYNPTDFIRSNYYIGCSKKLYKEGEFDTKIRFKFTGINNIYYSEPYEGSIDYCQFDNPDSWSDNGIPFQKRINAIIKSKNSIKEKIRLVNETDFGNHKEAKTRTLLSLHRKDRNYEKMAYYADELNRLNPSTGWGYYYKGMAYVQSAKTCFPQDQFLQKATIFLALEEWGKAVAFSDTSERAKKHINQYINYTLQRDEMNPLSKSIHLGCWINKTISLK